MVLSLIQIIISIIGGLVASVGVIILLLSPIIGDRVSNVLWSVEPVAYLGAVSLIIGLVIICVSYLLSQLADRKSTATMAESQALARWSTLTQQYFELFQHDLGRPFRRILGKERELRATIDTGINDIHKGVLDLFDEIEGQAPNFRLMMSNVQVLIQMEAPSSELVLQPVEPSEIVRRIVDRYTFAATDGKKEITWWSDPDDFGIVYSDGSAIEHIVTNLVDNAVRFASGRIEIKLLKEESQFEIKVWDDGLGIAEEYARHIFDRGWTPELAKREERTTSGLGMFIAKTLSTRYEGNLEVESIAGPDPQHYTEFTLTLPIQEYSG